ncbi:MAG: MATE family efflux transporter [Pseudomonadota bacterium]
MNLRKLLTNELNGRVWSIALPLMLANSSIALFGLIDAAVVGHLENASYLAGIALASVLFDFLYWGVTFLRMGTTGMVAQASGAGDIGQCKQLLIESILVALACAMLIIIFNDPIRHLGLSLLDGTRNANHQASIYFNIKIWGAPGVLATMVMMGWLIGMAEAKAVLAITAVTSLINAVLDITLVFVFDLGVAGVGYAALASAYAGALLGATQCARVLRKQNLGTRSFALQLTRLKRFLSLNLNIFVRTLCLISAFALFTHFGAVQGDVVLAANALLLSFQMLLALALDGYANALELLVGESIGRRDRSAFWHAVLIGTFWSGISAVMFSVFYFLVGTELIRLLTDLEQVRAAAVRYLPWMVLSPLVAVWCFVLDGIFIGATQGRAMRNSMLFALIVVYIPALILCERLGNHGIWAAFTAFFAARGLSMAWLFFQIDKRSGFIAAPEALKTVN